MGLRSQILALGMVCGLALGAGAQTLATGDARTVTEPAFPATCTVLTAQQAIVNDAPASETLYDTSRIQAALTACPSGQAVELAGASGNYAFLSATLNIPSGVGLIVDGGVTLYASRKASDYQVSGTSETCGSYGSNGNACNYFFTFNKGSSNTGSGIYGYGVIDLRGGSTILSSTGTDTGISWWTNADTATTAGKSQDNVSLMKPNKSTNLVLYKITIRNSPQFHIVTSNVSGETVWGVKIQAPFTAHNTDGIDPQGTNVSIINTSISEGDDAIAVSGSSASSNITVSNVNVYSSHGISIGSYTQSGVSNMLVKNVNMAGEPTDTNQNGLRIKSALDRGGLVQNVTYQNICMRDVYRPIYLTPVYNSNSGTLYPSFQNIVFQNMHVLATTKSTKYYVSLAGINANYLTTATFNNVVFDQAPFYSPAFSYDTIALSGNVYPSALQSQTGTGVSYTGSATATATPAYDCSATAAVFPFIVGELYASTSTATNLQSASISGGASVTLNAMVQPAKAQSSFSGTVGSYTGAAALTQPVNFYEGSTLVGTGTLGANSTNSSLATLTLTSVTAGTHTYTAQYPGDANYNALTFGAVTVTVAAASVTSNTALAVTGTLTYGSSQTLKATVTGTGGTPSGTVEFRDGTASLGSCTLTGGTCSLNATLTGGSHSLSAIYSGDGTFKTSTSTTSAITIATSSSTPTLTANPTTVSVNGATTLSVTVSGIASAAVPTGTVSFTDGTTSLGNATLDGNGAATFVATMSTPGSRTISVSYPGDSNYASSSASTTVLVTSATTTTLTLPSSASYGTSFSLSASVTGTGGTPTGTVTFLDSGLSIGSATLSSGSATATGLMLPAGLHNLTASYAGDAAGVYLASVSTAQQLNVLKAGTTTAATANPTTVAATGSTTIAVVVTGVSGAAAPSGNATITDITGGGSTVLGTAFLTNGSGSAAITLNTAGSRTLQVYYNGDANYGPSSHTIVFFVTTISTATTLTATPLTTYTGAAVTLTATVSPVTQGLTVTFATSGTQIGTATTNASGIATYQWTAPAVGTYSLSAATTASGNYGPSSGTASLSVVAPITVTATPNPIAIAAGSSGSVNVGVIAGGGFSATLAATCTSAVSYVTCTPASSTISTSTSSLTLTISVAATTGAIHASNPRALEFAFMALLGLAGLGLRRKRFTRLLILAVIAGMMGMAGCGGGTTASNGGGSSSPTKPSGSQTVTYTVTGGGVTVVTPITVNIQ